MTIGTLHESMKQIKDAFGENLQALVMDLQSLLEVEILKRHTSFSQIFCSRKSFFLFWKMKVLTSLSGNLQEFEAD